MTRKEQIKQAALNEPRVALGSFQRAFELGAQWADAHPDWIAAEDEMPPLEMDVLCVDKRGDHFIGRRVQSAQHGCGFGWVANYGYTNGGVSLWIYPTYWMPLTKSPRVK